MDDRVRWTTVRRLRGPDDAEERLDADLSDEDQLECWSCPGELERQEWLCCGCGQPRPRP